MSDTSVVYQCTYIKSDTSVSYALVPLSGDILQLYAQEGNGYKVASDTNFDTSNGGTAKKIKNVIVMSNGTAPVVASVTWKIGGMEIQFGANNISTNFSGQTFGANMFKRIPADGSDAECPYGGLIIQRNLVEAFNGMNTQIECVTKVERDISNLTTLYSSLPVRFVKVTGNSTIAEIYTSDDSFVITSADDTVTCKARLFFGMTLADLKQYRYEWYLFDSATSSWAHQAGKKNADLKITEDMVNSYQEVMVAFFPAADTTTTDPAKAVAVDLQTIIDEHDPLYIVPNPSPADGTLREDTATASSGVTFTPKVMSTNNGGSDVTSKYEFQFTVMDVVGNILNPSDTSKRYPTSYKVTKAMFDQAGDGPQVQIDAYKKGS